MVCACASMIGNAFKRLITRRCVVPASDGWLAMMRQMRGDVREGRTLSP